MSKSQAGKGHSIRPKNITEEEWTDNWNRAFRRAKKNPGKWTAVHPKWKSKR
jgi:hypothetical protein